MIVSDTLYAVVFHGITIGAFLGVLWFAAKKKGKASLLCILLILVNMAVNTLLSSYCLTHVYVVNQDKKTTEQYYSFGGPNTLHTKRRDYTIPAAPGLSVVVNNCEMPVAVDRLLYGEVKPRLSWGDVRIDPFTCKPVPVYKIDFLPGGEVPVSITVKSGESQVRFRLAVVF